MADNDDLVRILLLIVAIVVLVPFLVMLFARPMVGMWGGGHMWDDGAWNGSAATWPWLATWATGLLLFLGGGYLVYRVLGRPGGAETETDAALEELRLAYARGELSDEEFEERRRRLRRER